MQENYKEARRHQFILDSEETKQLLSIYYVLSNIRGASWAARSYNLSPE